MLYLSSIINYEAMLQKCHDIKFVTNNENRFLNES